MRQYLILSVLGLLLAGSPRPLAAQNDITITNMGKYQPLQKTNIDSGPTDPASNVNTGDILNHHYFPGLNFYAQFNYRNAKEEMDYVIARPQYIENNPKRGQILSVAHFVRGSIYFRHASGVGRLTLAKGDFEQSLKWNPENHLARLELARLVATLDQKTEAVSMLNDLLTRKLTASLRQEAENDLQSIQSGKFKAVTSE